MGWVDDMGCSRDRTRVRFEISSNDTNRSRDSPAAGLVRALGAMRGIVADYAFSLPWSR